MKLKFKLLVIAFATLIGGLGLNGYKPSQAAIKEWPAPTNHPKPFFKVDINSDPIPYKTNINRTSKGAYIWDQRHKKRLYNLKNYPKSRWYVYEAFRKVMKGKNHVYYRIGNMSNPKKKFGLVWSGYLTKDHAKVPTDFATDNSFIHYMQTSDTQRLNRALLKLFPSTKISLSFSQFMYKNSDHVLPASTTKYTNIIPLSNFTASDGVFYFAQTMGEPVNERVKQITKMLASHGYTKQTLANLNGYVLGIDVTDGYLIGKRSIKSPFPGYFDTVYSHYRFAIAKER